MGCNSSTSQVQSTKDDYLKENEPTRKDEENEDYGENSEIIDSLKTTISTFKDEIKKNEKEKIYTSSLLDIISDIGDFYSKAPEDDEILRRHIGRKLATSDTAKMLCNLVVELTSKKHREDVDLSLQYNCLATLVDYSDSVPEYSYIIVDHPKFLKSIGIILTQSLDTDDENEREEFLNYAITIIHNVAMTSLNVSKIRDLKFVDILEEYLNHPEQSIRFVAIATLADIVNEDESAILQEGQDTFKFLNKVLQNSIDAKDRHHIGWPAWELARTVRHIAKNDTNKRALVEQGCLPLLVKLAHSNDSKEQREAISALWTLSFDKENRKTIVSDENLGVIEVFTSYRKSSDKEVRKACEGALWTLREELSTVEKYRDLGQKLTGDKKDTINNNNKGHVMISYQWSYQKLIMQIRDELNKSGFKVWLDVDNMQGSTLQAMATAIENAEIILLCFGKTYKDSDNCRAEAEYAFEKRKQIVPLKMEHGYKPDGWLGIIIGSKTYYDFGGKYSFESRIDGLVKAIKVKYGAGQGAMVSEKSPDVSHQPMMQSESVQVSEWSQDDVTKWLDKHSLDKRKFKKLDGKTISYLQYLHQESPNSYNTALKEQLGIKDLSTMAAFTYALEHTHL